MELTRSWRAQHGENHIEVQWTGFRFRGGWRLRLLVNGELKAEHKVRRFVQNFEVQSGPVTVELLGQTVPSSVPDNRGWDCAYRQHSILKRIGLAVIFGPVGLVFVLALLSLI